MSSQDQINLPLQGFCKFLAHTCKQPPVCKKTVLPFSIEMRDDLLSQRNSCQQLTKGLVALQFKHCEHIQDSWSFACRIARHASANLSMELFRVPEDKMQQNIDFLEKIIEKSQDDRGIAATVADILPEQHIGTILDPEVLLLQSVDVC